MTYTNIHRFLLRTIASAGVITKEDAEKIVRNHADDQEISIPALVEKINEELRPIKQQIKITNDELSAEEVLVFMSLGFDDATKSQNLFPAADLEYFRILIEQIVTTENRQISGIHALNLVGNMKSTYTKTSAQKMLDTWCRMKYLDKEDTNYVLGVRTIHEFEGYLRENMADSIEECCLCKQIVLRGYNCIGCGNAVHTRCINKYTERVKKWPCCKIEFSADHLDRVYSQSSRLSQSQSNTVQDEINTDSPHENSEEMTQEISTQEIIPEMSQRGTRKRKRTDQ
ncbi:uncharacterized protein LOC125060162 [Pieris napi]|uniref:uncharacterized protein LOC125060162 n=1 Tax=Pieris napi TaxID=78633 RepID=UPI001FBB1CBC|nr:uncharacterized protein LOC125060162 [Pieris napi]